jgi:hypothetical protein
MIKTFEKFDAVRSLVGGELSQPLDGIIRYHSGQTPPSDSAIDTKLKELQADYDAKQYQRDRLYPPIGEQLDEIYHNGIDEWKKTIKKVKDAHPKPSE